MMGLKTAWPHLTFMPKDLNFAITGNITVTISGKAVCSMPCAALTI